MKSIFVDRFFFHFQKLPKVEFNIAIDKSTDTDDLILTEPSINCAEINVKDEQVKCSKRIKKEPKTRKRTKKSNRRKDDEGNI